MTNAKTFIQRIAQCFEYGIVPLYNESGKLANFGCYVYVMLLL